MCLADPAREILTKIADTGMLSVSNRRTVEMSKRIYQAPGAGFAAKVATALTTIGCGPRPVSSALPYLRAA